MNDLQPIILAAGMGTRLRPYTDEVPKALVRVNGVPLLDYQLAIQASCGLKPPIIVAGAHAEKFDPSIGEIVKVDDFSVTNMVWSLKSALSTLRGPGSILVSYGDIAYSKLILEQILAEDSMIAVAVDDRWLDYWSARSENPLDDAETLRLEPKTNRISEIGKKPTSLSEIESQFIGLMKFETSTLNQIMRAYSDLEAFPQKRPELRSAYMTDLLQFAIEIGYFVSAVRIVDDWVEVDTTDDLKNSATASRLERIMGEVALRKGSFRAN